MTDPWAVVPSVFLTHDEEEPAAEETRDRLAGWFHERLGVTLCGLARRTGGGGGAKSTIHFADTSHGQLVVRVPMPGTGWSAPLVGCSEFHCVAGEFAIARLAELGQPVPEVIAVERNRSILGAPFAVLRRLRPWRPPAVQLAAVLPRVWESGLEASRRAGLPVGDPAGEALAKGRGGRAESAESDASTAQTGA